MKRIALIGIDSFNERISIPAEMLEFVRLTNSDGDPINAFFKVKFIDDPDAPAEAESMAESREDLKTIGALTETLLQVSTNLMELKKGDPKARIEGMGGLPRDLAPPGWPDSDMQKRALRPNGPNHLAETITRDD